MERTLRPAPSNPGSCTDVVSRELCAADCPVAWLDAERARDDAAVRSRIFD